MRKQKRAVQQHVRIFNTGNIRVKHVSAACNMMNLYNDSDDDSDDSDGNNNDDNFWLMNKARS